MNMVVEVWLFKTDPKLTDIVAHEWVDDLKKGKTLYKLVPGYLQENGLSPGQRERTM